MKINEIINEAVNTNTGTPNGAPGNDPVMAASPGNQAPGAQTSQAVNTAPADKKSGRFWNGIKGAWDVHRARSQGGDTFRWYIGAWEKYAKQRGVLVNMRDPDILKQELEKWAKSKFPAAGDAVDVNKEIKNINGMGAITNYILKMYSAAMTNLQTGRISNTPAAAGSQTLPKGVQLISKEPIIVRYKNMDYAIGNNGEWTALKGDASNLESFKAYLDTVMGGAQ